MTPGETQKNGANYGPELPIDIDGHCLLQLDNETFMFVGGGNYHRRAIADTYFFHANNESFTTGPQLTEANVHMSCGVIETLDSSQEKIVVVAGGAPKFPFSDRIETWTVGSSASEFTRLNVTLPKDLHAAAAVVTSNRKSIVISGGYTEDWPNDGSGGSLNDALIKISCRSSIECQVEEMEQKLKSPRDSHVAMLVPDSLVNCH